MNKLINKIMIQTCLIVLTIVMSVSCVYASPIMKLHDDTVHGEAVTHEQNVENINKVIHEENSDDSTRRTGLVYHNESETITQEMNNNGYQEVLSERQENAKTFEKGEIRKTVIYNETIHFKKEGQWTDYNNDWKSSRSRGIASYSNTLGDHHYQIPAVLDNKSVITMDDVSFTIVNIGKSQGEVKEDSLLFKEVENQKDYCIQAVNDGIQIKSAVSDNDHELTQTYQLNLSQDMTAQLSQDKTTLLIYKNKEINTIIYPSSLKDADGNEIDIKSQQISFENNTVSVTPSSQQLGKLKTAPYSMEVTVKSVTKPDHSLIKFYGVRSGSRFENISYAPEVNPDYTHFAQVGRDPNGDINSGVSSPENVGLINIDYKRLVNEYIGEYRRIEGATLSLRMDTAISNTSTLSISQLREKMPLFDNYNNLKWTKYESYYNKYKDRTQSYSPKRLDTKTITRKPSQEQWLNFNIIDAIDYWYQGNPAYGLIVEGDSADTEGQAIYNHSSKNSNDKLPYMTITHVNDGPIDPALSLNSTTLNLRPFTQSNNSGMLNFSALGFDGLVRPNSRVDVQVVDTTNNSVVYNQNVMGSSTYRIYPLYSHIPNAQQYYRKTSNYQMPSLLLSSALTANHLYQVKYKVTAYDKDNKVTATKDWTNGETFQIYKVSGFDRVTRIMKCYNIANTSQFRLDNNMFDSLLVQGNLMFIRNPRSNQNKGYSSSSLSVTDKKAIDMALMGRGLHCEYGYEPVNYNTGNLYYSQQDAYFVEYGEKYYFERSYNSLSEVKGAYGNNWDLNWNYQLSMMDNCVVFSDGTGKLLTFFKDSAGNYQSPNGYQMTFKKNKIGEKTVYVDSGYYDEEEPPIQKAVTYNIYDYTVEDNNNHKSYHFNEEGYIQDVTLDEYGHKMTYTYNADYQIKEMTTSSGKVFTFTYNDQGLMTSISLPNHTTIKYDYDANGNMITFTDQKKYQIQYAYQGDGLLKSYTSRETKKVILTNEFDSQRRITKQTNALGQSATFEYQNDYTKVTDYHGKSQYIYLDNEKRTTKIVEQDGTESKNTYNNQNQLTSTIEDGQKTEYIYNTSGQLIHEKRNDGKQSTYVYNGEDVIKKTDFDGLETSYQYDSQHRIIKTIYSDKTYTENKYNADGQMIYERDVYGLEKTYTYSQGNKVKETDQNGYSLSYTYDALGMLSSITDQQGYKTEYIKDERGQKMKDILPHSTKQYTYDGDGNLIYEQDGNGNGTTYRYNALSQMIEKTDRYGTIKTEYDEDGRILKTIDELGYPKLYAYDSVGNKISETDQNGNTITYKYNNNHQLIETKDVNGIITYHSYDSLGQLIKEKRLDKVNTMTYNEQGKISEQDINGIKTIYKYDQYGNVIYKESRGIVEEYKYNHERLISQTIQGIKTSFTYDIYGHKTIEKDALGNETKYEYSPNGNLIKVIRPNQSVFQYTYDGEHRLLKTEDSLGYITSSTYDHNGNVLSKTDENGNIIKYTYSSRNLLLSTTDALGNVYTNKYNAKGQLIETTNPLKQIKKTTYTPTGLVSSQTDELKRTTKTIYNKLGQVIETRDVRDRKAINVYDDYGRLIEKQDVYGKKIKYIYNDYDELIKTIDDDGYIKTMSYDEHGFLISESNEKDQTTKYEYDNYGRLIKTTDIRGNTSSQTYDEVGRVVLSKDIRGVQSEYTYDKVGNLLIKKEGKVTTTYKYDILGRILKTTDDLERSQLYKYDKVGNIIETQDAKGYVTKNTYDANNNLLSTLNPKKQIVKYEYDALNRTIKKFNPDLTFSTNQYDEVGRIISTTNELGYKSEVTYNDLNQEVEMKDAKGHISINEYNDHDLLSKTSYPDDASLLYTYDDKNNLIKIIDTNNEVYQYEYDKYNHKTKETAPNGYYKTYTFNDYDQVLSLSDNDGLLLSYEYNEYGDVVSTSNILKQKNTTTYNEYGQVISETDMKGNTSTTEYDQLNRIKKETDIRGNITTYIYDELNRVVETKLNDVKTSQEYDEIGNVIVDKDALGNETHYEYNKRNQLIKTTNALHQTTTYTYDKLGQKLSQTDAKGQTISYGYDELGNKTKEINPEGQEKLYHYDSVNQMISMQTEDNKVLDYQYDNYGNISKILLKDQVKYEFKYDNNNQLIEQIDAKKNKDTYTYYLNGNMKSYVNKKGVETLYEYNQSNQLIHMYTDHIDTKYQYDKDSQMIKAIRDDQVSLFEYDQYGAITKTIDPNKQNVSYEYDQLGRKSKMIYPSGKEVTYQYNDNNQIISVHDGKQETTYSYDQLNREVLAKNNHQEKKTEYDEIGQLILSETKMKDKTVTYEYQYDKKGNTIKEVSNINKQKTEKTMTYDPIGQLLTSEYKKDGDIRVNKYTYDDSGNRILYEENHNGNKIEKQSHYNANDELLTDGKASYTYDDQGNVVKKVYEDGHTQELEYNDYNELILVKSSLGQTIEYGYDALGNRISKEEIIPLNDKDLVKHLKADMRMPDLKDIKDVEKALKTKMKDYEDILSQGLDKQTATWLTNQGINVKTNYVNDITKENVEVIELQQNKKVESYTYGNQRVSAQTNNQLTNYIYDGKMNVVSENGTLDNVYLYDDYGSIIQNINDGYAYSSESTDYDYQYLRARYYETDNGRFIQRDNYLGDKHSSDYNQYIYGLNNPDMYKDPSGHFSLWGFFEDVGNAFGSAFDYVNKKIVQPAFNFVYKNLVKPVISFVDKNLIKPIVKTYNSIQKTVKNNAINDKKLQKELVAYKKSLEVKKTKENFESYANEYGLDEAYAKYKNVDKQLLEAIVKAYCDKMGLDHLSVMKALESVSKVENKVSLSMKYAVISENVKYTVDSVNVSAIQSAVGYSGLSSVHKVYITKAIDTLSYSRDLAMNIVWNISSIQSKINGIYSYTGGTTELNKEYASDMLNYSSQIGTFVSSSSQYITVKPWHSDGTYSSGYYTQMRVHKDGRLARAYGNIIYKFFVPVTATVQGQADKIEFVSAMVGSMNQAYNPYQTSGNTLNGSKGSGGNDSASNSNTPNSSTSNVGNTSGKSYSGQEANGSNQPSYSQSPGNTGESYSGGGSVNTPPEGASGAGFETLETETINKTVGEKITGYTKHGLNQAIGRDGGKGVSPEAILDTIRNPKDVIQQSSQYGPTYKYVSDKAVVVLNEEGKVVTTYAKGSQWIRGGK